MVFVTTPTGSEIVVFVAASVYEIKEAEGTAAAAAEDTAEEWTIPLPEETVEFVGVVDLG